MGTIQKACLILLPLAIMGMRLHARAASTPVEATREVNRCLAVVRAAARRGRDGAVREHRERKPHQQDTPPGAMTPACSEVRRRIA
jgi:hypothetical protein